MRRMCDGLRGGWGGGGQVMEDGFRAVPEGFRCGGVNFRGVGDMLNWYVADGGGDGRGPGGGCGGCRHADVGWQRSKLPLISERRHRFRPVPVQLGRCRQRCGACRQVSRRRCLPPSLLTAQSLLRVLRFIRINPWRR